MKLPENRLTPEEIAYQKKGDSEEIVEWNRQFGLLIGEYWAAVECEDEGWIGNTVHEVRKILGENLRQDYSLRIFTYRDLYVKD